MILDRIPLGQTVVVAMSGGVDSSCVAALLHQAGYNVIGITLQLYNQGAIAAKKGACCAGQDIYDAKMVAEKFGFPHYVFDYEDKFNESVIDNFVQEYIQGQTPLPCVKCNQSVKFRDLLGFARDLGAKALATGHYVQKVMGQDGAELHKGADPAKDQSYFLFSTTRQQLDFLEFPLGAWPKAKTRAVAQSLGLDTANKPDSQDICFVPNGSYHELILKKRPDAQKPGKIVHVEGFELGTHDGIIGYTIGQRRRIGVSYHEPLYVVKIDPDTNTIFVGQERYLKRSTVRVDRVNWLDSREIEVGRRIQAKIRSTHQATEGQIKAIEGDVVEVEFIDHQKAVAPGQACVFYDDARGLGGGWILPA